MKEVVYLKQTIKIDTSTGVTEVYFGDTPTPERPQIITIKKGGRTVTDTARIFEPASPDIHPFSLDIWRRYETVRLGNLVIRSGFGLCGCYDSYQPEPNPRRQESDTEHASGCVELVRSLAAYYPNLLLPRLYPRLEHLLKDHDIGENNYGDQPDDGSQNRTEKDQVELTSFVLATARLPDEIRRLAIEDFIRFQTPLDPVHPKELAQMAQLAKVVDKLETILSSAIYEKAGFPGDLTYKRSHYGGITAQDQFFIHASDDDPTILASWLAHATHNYHSYYGFPYVLDIVKAAVIDIRGQWFPWFDRFCKKQGIPKQHIIHPYLNNS